MQEEICGNGGPEPRHGHPLAAVSGCCVVWYLYILWCYSGLKAEGGGLRIPKGGQPGRGGEVVVGGGDGGVDRRRPEVRSSRVEQWTGWEIRR